MSENDINSAAIQLLSLPRICAKQSVVETFKQFVTLLHLRAYFNGKLSDADVRLTLNFPAKWNSFFAWAL